MSDEKSKLLRKSVQDKDYFSVIRKGISKQKIMMRFGQIIWSEHENYVKKKLIIVEETYDKYYPTKIKSITEIKNRNIEKMLAYTSNYMKELNQLLIKNEIVSEEEIDVLKARANKNIKKNKRQFYKVEDIDK